MAEGPWLTIIGLGEDGPEGLSAASHAALLEAEVIMAPPRHLSLLPDLAADLVEWPVPFAEGIPLLKSFAGRRVVVLASGDPFWFGAGSVIAREFSAAQWRALPGPSTFALAAAHLGWPLERTTCLGLHAAPLTRLRPHLAPGARLIVLLRDASALDALARYLQDEGFGDSTLWAMEALGGPREKISKTKANALTGRFAPPLCAALELAGSGQTVPHASGLPDTLFANDGALTKRPVRALTLSALAPRYGETLWDIGSGSGSIAIEWLLSHPSTGAIAIEPRPERAARIRANADKLGQDRLTLIEGNAPEALAGLPPPDAVFIGGGLSRALLEALTPGLPPGTRLVANAVTLESEALLAEWHTRLGGELLRIELAQAGALGARRGWKSAYPVVQWSVTL